MVELGADELSFVSIDWIGHNERYRRISDIRISFLNTYAIKLSCAKSSCSTRHKAVKPVYEPASAHNAQVAGGKSVNE